MKSDNKQPLLILTDSLSTRVFFSSGIVQRLWKECGGKITILVLFDVDSVFDYHRWLKPDEDIFVESVGSLDLSGSMSFSEKLYQIFDSWLDKHIGFFPLAVRFSLLHRYHLSRFRRKHSNPFLNSSLAFPFPHSRRLFTWFRAWYFSSVRFVEPALKVYLSENTSCIITTNLQVYNVQQFIHAAYQLGLRVVGHIGSWDHPVGKGVVFPYCFKYIVQNDYMLIKLVEQHSIPEEKVVVTGWPQMDFFARERSVAEFSDLLQEYGLDSDKPCVLIAGNSEANSPYEPAFVRRLISWWEGNVNNDFSIIFRPHPRDIINDNWKQRFGFLIDKNNLYVQAANYADIEVLSLLLQYVACVVTNAGTILLDSLANNRPVVCVLYDENAPTKSKCALNNIAGDHYKEIIESGAFVTAYDFDTVVDGLRASMKYPDQYEKERNDISGRIVGVVDGLAGKRVGDVIIRSINSF